MRRAWPRRSPPLLPALLLLSLLLSLGPHDATAEDAARASVRATAAPFDYFVFVRQWPGTLCSEHACPLLRRAEWGRFTIHGLWPSYKRAGSHPADCGGGAAAYSAAQVHDLRAALDDAWPSLRDASNSNDAFWAHEWAKHGTCARAVLPDQHKYFGAALRLDEQLSLQAALQRAGVAPSSARAYPPEQLQRAVSDAHGVAARLHCDAQGQLTEVWMCLDLDLMPIDCKDLPEEQTECKRAVTLPPLPGTDSDGTWGGQGSATATTTTTSPDGGATLPAHPGGAAAATASASASARQPHRSPRRPAAPDSVLRTLCIAGAGATLLCVVALTLASSWARRTSLAAAAATGHHSRSPSQCSLQDGGADALPLRARQGVAAEMQDWGAAAEDDAVVLLFNGPPPPAAAAALLRGDEEGEQDEEAASRPRAWLGGAAVGGDGLRRPLLLP